MGSGMLMTFFITLLRHILLHKRVGAAPADFFYYIVAAHIATKTCGCCPR